ncbi:MAG TPA: hypothetical protein VFP65_14240 [Anaeromyxobacteraceae bacterium]|nr:hypothetical protein [Anaeromyxobacteraceae bacterium]
MIAAPAALVEVLGWLATATVVGSYFFARPELLVRAQMVGAVMWIAYGALAGAKPVVVANLLVVAAAAWKARRAAAAQAVGGAPPAGQASIS